MNKPSALLRTIVSRTNRRNAQVGYGYQWWVPKPNEGRAEIFAGQGYGGQFMMIAPDYNLLLVINGWNIHGESEKASYWLMQERIISNITD